MNAVTLALEALHQRYRNLWLNERGEAPRAEFDRAWPSPCVQQTHDNEDVFAYHWQAKPRHSTSLFAPLEQALEVTIHPDLIAFYGGFWADSIPIEHPLSDGLLLQIWNQEDEQRLLENQLGHAFARLKGRLPLSFFIACTHSELNICLDNQSGEIVLDRPGFEAHKVVAASLEQFLLTSSPCLDHYG